MDGPAGRRRREGRWPQRTAVLLTAAITVALLAAGTALAIALTSGSGDPPAAAKLHSGSSSTQNSGSTKPAANPANPGSCPGVPQGVPCPPAAPPGRRPRQQLALSQQAGGSQTLFAVSGTGWPPRIPLTLTLSNGRASGESMPFFSNRAGRFRYVINQGYRLFPAGLPPGTYQVVVTGPRGPRAVTSFMVQGS